MSAIVEPGELCFHIVVAAVSAQEDVARQLLEYAKHLLVVRRDLRILGIVHQLVSGIHIGTAHDHHVVTLAGIAGLQRPGGASLGVSRRKMRGKHRAAQPYFVAVVKNAIDFGRRIKILRLVPILEIGLASRFHYRDVAVHHHVLRPGELLDLLAAGVVVPMGMANEQDLHVGKAKAELLDALANLRRRTFEVAVDEDVPVGRGYQIRSQAAAAHVVHVAHNLEGGKGFSPTRVGLREQASGEKKQKRD